MLLYKSKSRQIKTSAVAESPGITAPFGKKPAVFSLQPAASGAAFTILELLVVISIIAILIGLIVPTFGKAREKAKIAKAKVTVKNLETACNEYFNHYKRWPKAGAVEGTEYPVQDDLYLNLRGAEDAPDNPSRIAFFDFEKPPAGGNANTCYDPWSYDRSASTNLMPYYVQFDVGLDNKININGVDVYKSVIVWCVGPDRTKNTPDDITSWE